MIQIDALNYTFPKADYRALKDLSLTVEEGDFVLIAGPSGAGKSTFLKCLNGLVPHFSGGKISGKLRVAGLDPIAHGPGRLSKHVGIVFQNPEAQMVLDIVETEIAFGMENMAVTRSEMRRRVAEVLDLLEIADLRQRRLNTLSGGERQMVAIAAALVGQPKIMLFDEPTSQLDFHSAEEVLQAILSIHRELGLTVLLSEHRLERILPYANRLVYMKNGRFTGDMPVSSKSRVNGHRSSGIYHLGRYPLQEQTILSSQDGRLGKDLPPSIQSVQVPVVSTTHSSDKPLLDVTGISFGYGDQPLLKEINFKLYSGEAVVLLGRNGVGKSTLLRCLVGLLKPQAGKIIFNGRSIVGEPVAKICREIAYLPQTPDDLLFADNVAEELRVTMDNHALSEKDLPVSPGQLLKQLGLDGVAETYPRDLSVGQRQRVALGAVMITAPPLLILDEPTRGLDPAAKTSLAKLWRKWQHSGMALLLVTHDYLFAADVADRILVLSEGQLTSVDSMDELSLPLITQYTIDEGIDIEFKSMPPGGAIEIMRNLYAQVDQDLHSDR